MERGLGDGKIRGGGTGQVMKGSVGPLRNSDFFLTEKPRKGFRHTMCMDGAEDQM